MNETGYAQIRRGILQHVREGRITHQEALAYLLMILSADPATGVWFGSAKALGDLGFAERQARQVLENLEAKRYLRRFATPGKHFNYPILLNKFEPTSGREHGKRLNAFSSKSPTELCFEIREHRVKHRVEHNGEHRVEHGDHDRTLVIEPVLRDLRKEKGKQHGNTTEPGTEQRRHGPRPEPAGRTAGVTMRPVRL